LKLLSSTGFRYRLEQRTKSEMSAVRARIEALLKTRKLDVTLMPADASALDRRAESTGLAALDERLAGGWPCGEISEIVGPASSGRTALLWATMSAATARGHLVAVVDALDTFDPRPAAELGVDLAQVLWIRGRREEGSSDRRGAPAHARLVDRAIKAFGLVLDAGGFGVVALDLADVPGAWLARLPFTTWRRLQRMVEGREIVALVVAPEPMARSARGVTVRLTGDAAATPVWQGTSARARRLAGLALAPQIVAARRLL
jgi:hypothetical protein